MVCARCSDLSVNFFMALWKQVVSSDAESLPAWNTVIHVGDIPRE